MTDWNTYADDRYLGLPGPWDGTWYSCAACGRATTVREGAAAKRRQWKRVLPSDALADRINTHATPYGVTVGWLQVNFRLEYEAASAIVDVATAFGLLQDQGIDYQRAPALCPVCYDRLAEAALAPPPTPAPRPADPGRDPIPAQLRFRVLQRDAFRCQYCGRTAASGATLHVDHIVPLDAGGATSEDNLMTACEQCNLGKSDAAVVG